MNNIFTGVSIRKYQDRPVEKEKTLALLRAAMQAPSAANQQLWEFYVVTYKTKLSEIGIRRVIAVPFLGGFTYEYKNFQSM